MERILSEAPLIRYVVSTGALSDHPLTLLDVGCSGGIDRVWREFEPVLLAHGVEPMPREVARLRARERNPSIHYHCAFLQLPDDHPFVVQRGNGPYFDPAILSRLSTQHIAHKMAGCKPAPSDEEILTHNRWADSPDLASTPTLTPVELFQRTGREQFDFIKIDVDGPDFEILVGLEDALRTAFGVGIEVTFVGSDKETVNTFHNVDRLMRRHGFSLVHLTHRAYSRAALPAPFEWSMVAQTTFGPPLQGDAVYIRDPLATDQVPELANLSDVQLLKIVCLYAMCNLPDCAAELLLHFRSRLQTTIDLDHALNLLTPAMMDGPVSYQDYLSRFHNEMETWFYPPYHRPPAPEPIVAPPVRGNVWRVGRWAGMLSVLAAVGGFVVESAMEGGSWVLAAFTVGLVVWLTCWLLSAIPNKKQLLGRFLATIKPKADSEGRLQETPRKAAA